MARKVIRSVILLLYLFLFSVPFLLSFFHIFLTLLVRKHLRRENGGKKTLKEAEARVKHGREKDGKIRGNKGMQIPWDEGDEVGECRGPLPRRNEKFISRAGGRAQPAWFCYQPRGPLLTRPLPGTSSLNYQFGGFGTACSDDRTCLA